MKSLVESLFDKDLVSKKLMWDEMMDFCNINKNHIADISNLIMNFWFFKFTKSKGCIEWVNHMREEVENLGDFFDYNLAPPDMLKKLKNYISKTEDTDFESRIKPGKIHKKIDYVIKTHLNSSGISWRAWDNSNDVSEWIFYVFDDIPFVIINRKTYDERDQQVIHSMIENVHKYYKKK